MSGSATPDRPALERELESLEKAVGRLLDELASLRRRAETAEAGHRRLEETLRRSRVDAGDPASLERRLRELSEENARLRAVLSEARERAERIRGRLIVIEDETAD
jgi:predicted RNase H-like nuclease (RuvC/YqgF family)